MCALLTWTLLFTWASLSICQEIAVAFGTHASPDLVAELDELLIAEATVACCGFWSSAPAADLRREVATMLQLPQSRYVGDVHLENASMGVSSVHTTGSPVHWGALMVLFLNDPAGAEIHLRGSEGHQMLGVGRGTMLLVPEGSALIFSVPLRLAWVRIRQPSSPPRGVFEFYIASWIQKHFIAPYDTVRQRRFFRAHVKHPRYWHGFFWSFIGMFCTIFACMPIAWWSVQILLSLQSAKEPEVFDAERGIAADMPRTLLPKVGRGRAPSQSFPSIDKLKKDVSDFSLAGPVGCRM
eukprot:TRINITY_DN106482_c0_g1_i1.p1 TRINITY_DN106482_c0_g1~~TRINITY_DN106482_c0_g1_i1.p1  ORF type:complete len:296 (-),score=48.76 TRINITY_DN106482_c0_g1_i1:182-1069(-)